MDWLENLSVEEQKAWSELMIDHAFDQSEWGDARIELLILLEKDGKKADECALRSYLSCCAESAGPANPLPSLSLLVNEFYSAYGMDAAKVEES